MDTYTNVVFDRYEVERLQGALTIITIAFSDYHEMVTASKDAKFKRNEIRKAQRAGEVGTYRATALAKLTRDPTQGTHEVVKDALWAVEMLAHQVELEAELSYWLVLHPNTPESTDPTSSYAQLSMLAGIRRDQLDRVVRPALELLTDAAYRTSSRKTAEMELP
jgi:hypothetical protein